jgi:hypothetical protein
VTKVADDLVGKYMKQLESELADLPRARRREILDEIGEHIAEAQAESEVDVRNVLDRVGDPDEIAEEARSRFGVKRAKSGAVEILALVLLPLGGFVFLVGWFVGVALLWGSSVWTTREKLLGTLIVPGGLITPITLAMISIGGHGCGGISDDRGRVIRSTCDSGGGMSAGDVLWIAVLVFSVVGPLVMTAYLTRQMRRRSA